MNACLHTLLDLVSAIELGLRTFSRRNRSIRDFLNLAHPANDPKADARAGLLPQFLIEDRGQEIPFWTEEECDDYRQAHNLEFQTESEFERVDKGSLDKGPSLPPSVDTVQGVNREGSRPVRRVELHEVKLLNKHLGRLRDEFDLRRGAASTRSYW